MARDTKDRVPFSWEQTPGKPKDLEANDSRGMDVPPPKLPPGRQQPMKQTPEPCHVDEDGCNGDDDDNGDDDVFSDAIDVFSLSESIDVPEVEACGGGGHQSSFMIQRFLTDANELAAASSAALAISKKLNKNPTRERNNSYRRGSVPKAVDQSYTSPQGCGVDIFLPWWLKLKPCGLKRPVRQASLSVKPQWDATRKKKG